jgi:hypothetical protein
MFANENVPELATALPEPDTAATNIVPVPQFLTPQEKERICRAFIRLIAAEEGKPTDTHVTLCSS